MNDRVLTKAEWLPSFQKLSFLEIENQLFVVQE